MLKISLVLNSAMLSSCLLCACALVEPGPQIGAGPWYATKLGEWEVPKKAELVVSFSDEGVLHASAGCNFIFTDFVEEGRKRITEKPTNITAKYCHGAKRENEEKLSAAIAKSHSWAVTENKLVSRDKSGEIVGTFARNKK